MSISMSTIKNITHCDRIETKYRELEYIQSTNNEYIDTKYYSSISNTPLPIKIDFQFTELATSGNMCFGTLGGSSPDWIRHHLLWNSSSAQYGVGDTLYPNVTKDTNRHVIDIGYTTFGTIKYDNNIITTGATTMSSSNKLNYYLFARNSKGTADSFCKMKLYSCELKYGNTLVKLIPCQRKSDNVCGLYNMATRAFIAMKGTNITTTAAGPIVSENIKINPKSIRYLYSEDQTKFWSIYDVNVYYENFRLESGYGGDYTTIPEAAIGLPSSYKGLKCVLLKSTEITAITNHSYTENTVITSGCNVNTENRWAKWQTTNYYFALMYEHQIHYIGSTDDTLSDGSLVTLTTDKTKARSWYCVQRLINNTYVANTLELSPNAPWDTNRYRMGYVNGKLVYTNSVAYPATTFGALNQATNGNNWVQAVISYNR